MPGAGPVGSTSTCACAAASKRDVLAALPACNRQRGAARSAPTTVRQPLPTPRRPTHSDTTLRSNLVDRSRDAPATANGITERELADRSKRRRPPTIVRSQVTVPRARRLLHTQRSCRARERASMSPEQAYVINPISLAFVIYASMHVNILMAKRKIREWEKWSTLVFVWSTGMGGIKRRASLIWMNRFGYDEAEALILAKYQSLAIFGAFVGTCS